MNFKNNFLMFFHILISSETTPSISKIRCGINIVAGTMTIWIICLTIYRVAGLNMKFITCLKTGFLSSLISYNTETFACQVFKIRWVGRRSIVHSQFYLCRKWDGGDLWFITKKFDLAQRTGKTLQNLLSSSQLYTSVLVPRISCL